MERFVGSTPVVAAVLVAVLSAPAAVRADPGGEEARRLSPKAALGKALFFDTTLSNPPGQSCGSCHTPSTGFTFPDSHFNLTLGTAPGAVQGRFVSRAVPQISYSVFNRPGPPFFDGVIELYVGGQFWDGHAVDLADQAAMPFVNPNEMNNLTNGVPDPAMVVTKVKDGRSGRLFKRVYGDTIFYGPPEAAFSAIADAIAEYEKSTEVSPFSSKYDAWRMGRVEFTPSELNGLRLVTGSWTGRPDGAPFPRFAQCVACHSINSVASAGPDLWTNTCYQNIGVPRNPGNPFYTQTDAASNPLGFNPLGQNFIDYGLGVTLYANLGLPPGNTGPGTDGHGDFLGVNGQFKAPSLRNVDLRPRPGFVKAYMHNGSIKSLKDVVHFYNTRNLTTQPGEVIDFTRAFPYDGLVGTPLWGAPEYPSTDTLLNPDGLLPNDPAAMSGFPGESAAQVGNLGLSEQEEDDIVAFLRALSDGFFNPDLNATCDQIMSQPVSQTTCLNGSIKMTVAVRNPKPLAYQWRHGDPPVPIPGADLSYYTIVAVLATDAGPYDCVITTSCGTAVSRSASVSICAADFDCSGDLSVQDLFAYLNAWFYKAKQADLNASGTITPQDLFDFLKYWFAGC